MKRAAFTLSTLLLLAACSTPRPVTDDRAVPESNGNVRFSVIGDMPYLPHEHPMLTAPDGAIVKAVRAYDPPVLIHLGDLKSGDSACTDSLLVARRDQIFDLNPYRAVYTPGDNDWTDCDREEMSPQFDELERLSFIRSIFYQSDEGAKLTRDIPGLTRQSGFVENAMWTINGLVFGTLHIPGTNNGRDEFFPPSDVDKALDEADRRDAFNEAWVDSLFDAAASAPALVITFQADIYYPDLDKSHKECTTQNRQDCDGFKRIRDYMERKAVLYQKPVLLVHGDTNAYCFHKPVGLAINLWRLNAPGDFKLSDAAQVAFDPDDTETPFEVQAMLTKTPLPKICDYSR